MDYINYVILKRLFFWLIKCHAWLFITFIIIIYLNHSNENEEHIYCLCSMYTGTSGSWKRPPLNSLLHQVRGLATVNDSRE